MMDSRFRFLVIKLMIFLMIFLLISRLFNLQVINGEHYREVARDRLNVNMMQEAPRGQIYDRYGTPLAVNREGYSLKLIKVNVSDEEFNIMLLKLLDVLKNTNTVFLDTFPVSEYPFSFTFENSKEEEEWFLKNPKIKEDMSADEVIDEYSKIYNISDDFENNDRRKLIGFKYEMDIRGFSPLKPVVIAEDISTELVLAIKERQNEFPCITVTTTYYREYKNGGYASHIIGRTGKLSSSEYEKYKNDGYSYDDVIGKQGVEKSAEKYLRGTDGAGGIKKEINGKSITLIDEVLPKSGNSVILTIDMNMQKVLEDSLAANINRISENGGETEGSDADSGAAAVIDIKSGDLLACASYPTYDLSTFNRDYLLLLDNKAKPMWNRAVSGTYTPGSTFKPLVAIAALQEKKITPDELIADEGIYSFYEDYRPKCWIWQEGGATHGSINVSAAIEKSCNYFFYETGRRTGIDIISKYGESFGLGELTGVELFEEVKGSVANPEYKQKVVKDERERRWFGADTLQAAIGQSYHAITPIQLANYAATIAKGGVRHKVNLIKTVRDIKDNTAVFERTPAVIENIKISEENIQAVKEGMKNVVDEGSAHAIFSGYPIKIGGKTGTAQLGKNVSNNAFFIAFAPFDNPEIAICVVIEHGVRGANAAYVARDLFDYYFKVRNTQ